jgi:hypothetical protein
MGKPATDKTLLSWRVALLPFLGQGELHAKFKLDEPWDSEHNRTLLDRLPQIYRDPQVADKTLTTFQVFSGKGTVFGDKPFHLYKITDGTTNTVSVVQSPPEQAVPWTKPQDIPFDPEDPIGALGKIPADGIFAAMFDGSVYKIPSDYPKDSWRKLIQPNDAESVELPPR